MPPHVPPTPMPIPEPVPQLPAINVAAFLAQLQQLAATVQALQHQNAALQDQLNAQAVHHPLLPQLQPLLQKSK
jgi:hypothetical protein